MIKTIQLSGGGEAIVDELDYAWLALWKWRLNKAGYVVRSGYRNGRRTTILLHRFIMDAPDGLEVDHRNRVRHDCRRSNLKLATRTENEHNKDLQRRNTTGYKGVILDKRTGRYRAKIYRGRYIHLGTFDTAPEAAQAYAEYIATEALNETGC